MKIKSFNASLILAAVVMLVSFSCASAPGAGQGDTGLDLSKVKTIGLLVARVGNKTFQECPVPIVARTDYANRVPKTGMALVVAVAKEDVIIENDERIAQSLPHYPYWEEYRAENGWEKHYKNISAPLYADLASSIRGLGYQVADARAALAAKGRDVFEMRVGDIVKEMEGTCDLLLILHYADVGDSHHFVDGASYDHRGFSVFKYSYAAFDIATGNRRASNSVTASVPDLIAADPSIAADPGLRSRVRVANGAVEHNFNDDEIVRFLASAILEGAKGFYADGQPWNFPGIARFLRKNSP